MMLAAGAEGSIRVIVEIGWVEAIHPGEPPNRKMSFPLQTLPEKALLGIVTPDWVTDPVAGSNINTSEKAWQSLDRSPPMIQAF